LKNKLLQTICFILTAFCGLAQAPAANFTSDVTGGCSPIVVNFTDQSSNNPTSWLWDFGNGATSTRQNPSTTYFAPGTYTVTLTATNAAGSNTVTKTAYITVFTQPVADFITDKTSGCSPQTIQFTDQSTSPPGTTITSWLWSFGDGGSSTQRNPQYIYRSAGSYTITLTITNDKGCTKLITKPNYINISAGVSPSFNYADPGVCSAPATINYNNTSSGPGTLSYFWNLGNGNTATTFHAGTTYTSNGTYRVSLVASSSAGCIDSAVQNVVVGRVNTDFIIPAAICPKATVQFINNSTPRPISSVWQFSNGTSDNLINGQTSFSTPGTYTVTLINTYSICTDTLVKTITVANGPTINFKASDTAKCSVPQTINFTNLSNAVSYKWYFGDGDSSTTTNPSHTYTAFGEYDVTLIATGTNGCIDTLIKRKYIKIRKPVITFPNLPTRGCVPKIVPFSANILAADSVISYNWNFGDGSPNSTLANPSHTYTIQGSYTVTLTIVTSSGCTETISIPAAVNVGTKPEASFTAAPLNVCASAGVQFTNTSPKLPGNNYSYYWDFGDGSNSVLENPLHIYNDTGYMDIKFVVANSGCDSDTLIKLKHVYIKPPVSKFKYRPDCNRPLEYTFTDASIGALTWEWNFGDGTTFTGQNPPPHTFPGLGTYNVTLTTTNGSCTYTTTRSVLIADNTPNFSAPVREGCKPFTATFTATATNPGLIKKYLWDFGNGASFNADSLTTAQFTYLNAGNFYVKLTTVDSFGCGHTIIKDPYIRVNGALANFGAVTASGCKGLNVSFLDSTITDGVNAIVKWEWNFGDGTTQTFTAPPFTHVYDTIGNFDVSLTVTDAKGCTHKITKREFVKISKINAKWSTSGQTCPNSPIGFSNESLSDLPFTSFWDFGDTQTSTITSPSHAYSDTGYYTVKLVIRDILGCEDSLIKINAVHVSLPKANFTANNFVTYCTPFEAKFTNTSGFYNSSFWDLSIATSTQQHPSIYYSSTGTYPIKLVVTSPGGCRDSITKTLVVKNPNDGNLTYAPLNGCSPLNVDFSAFSEMNARFIWDFGDGNVTDTSINALTHIYRDFGDFVPKVILIEPGNTCVVPITGLDVINVLGVKAKVCIR
jgi:PKD repeat protein